MVVLCIKDLRLDWLYRNYQLVNVVKVERDASDDDWLQVGPVLAWGEWLDRTLWMILEIGIVLCIDNLRLYLQMSLEIRVCELFIRGHLQSLEELVRLLGNLSRSLAHRVEVDGHLVANRLCILFGHVQRRVNVDEVLRSP